MSSFKKNVHFLNFIAYNTNKDQNYALLKRITSSQNSTLKKIAKDILTETIPISDSEFKKLVQSRNFIRKLSESKKISYKGKLPVVQLLVKIALKEYEIYAKVGSSSNRGMGTNKRKKFQKKKTNCDSDTSEPSSISTNTTSSTDSNTLDGSGEENITSEEEELKSYEDEEEGKCEEKCMEESG